MQPCANPKCTVVFEPKRPDHRYCRNRCAWKAWYDAQPARAKRTKHPQRCAACDEWFVPFRSDHLCCSTECGAALSNAQRGIRAIRCCAECGHEYYHHRHGQDCCSERCSTARRRSDRIDALVYFIRADNGPIKIGIAANPAERLRSLRSANAYPLSLRRVEPGGRTRERELHRLFAAARMEGEWFAPVPELLALLEDR